MEKKKGFAAAFMAGTLWAVGSPMAQYLFEHKGVTSPWLVPYRLLASGLILFLYALLIKRQAPLSVWKDRKDALRQLCFSLFGMMGMQYSFFMAVQETNGGTATIFQYLNPAMLLLYFAVFKGQRPKLREYIAVICTVAGIFLVATHGNPGQLTVSPKGLVLGFILALTTCFYGLIPGPLLKKYPSEMICAWAMLIGGAVLTLTTRPWQYAVKMDLMVVIAFLGIVILGTIIPFCIYLYAVKTIGSVYSGLLSAVEPVVATVLAAVLLGTSFTAMDIIGFALILSTVFILNLKPKIQADKT